MASSSAVSPFSTQLEALLHVPAGGPGPSNLQTPVAAIFDEVIRTIPQDAQRAALCQMIHPLSPQARAQLRQLCSQSPSPTPLSRMILDALQRESGLGEMPFKKSLTIASLLLFDTPHSDAEAVAALARSMSNYAVLESQAEEVVRPLQAARARFKEVVAHTTFQSMDDVDRVTQQLQTDTDRATSHNIDELHRDNLLRIDGIADPVLGSARYEEILRVAMEYQAQQHTLHEHPLFSKIDAARDALKPLMTAFIQKNYSSIEELRQAFASPVRKVDAYLDALK